MRQPKPPSFKKITAYLILGFGLALIDYASFKSLGFDDVLASISSNFVLILFAVIAVIDAMLFNN